MKIFLLACICLLVPVIAQAEEIYACVDAQHQTVYTNKEVKGQTCTRLHLPQLSTVPNYKTSQPAPPSVPLSSHSTNSPIQDFPLVVGERQTYEIHPSVGHNVASQVCDLYGKWLDLNLSTRGGFYYNNLTAPLMTMFGGGYIPMECR